MQNILSFGEVPVTLPLGRLTVLIGPNGSGKSNVLEVFSMLNQLARTRLGESIPINDLIWKGAGGVFPTARVEASVTWLGALGIIKHQLGFGNVFGQSKIAEERIEHDDLPKTSNEPKVIFESNGRGAKLAAVFEGKRQIVDLKPEEYDFDRSVLSQRADHTIYPEVAGLSSEFSCIRLYRDINFGEGAPMRRPQRTDLPNQFLLEDGSNLGLILNRLKINAAVQRTLLKYLKKFYEPAEGVDVHIQGGTAQIYITEGDWTIPATRLSDGTMRWLSLLSVLLDPSPWGVVCFDEPDLGLHPDVIPTLADLLIEASSRIQIVLTTHNDALVDALGDVPDRVVVCEKEDGVTALRRLDAETLKEWLAKYSLGELWRRGQIGGNRW